MSTVLEDGFPTKLSFSSSQLSSAAVVVNLMEEKEVTPPGVSGGGANDVSSMRNTTWRTNAPKGLKTLTPVTVTVAYDPALYDEMVAMVNDNQLITMTFPDDSTLKFWAWIDEFVPNAHTEGAQPTAAITLIPSNRNASKEETAPVYATAA